MDFPAQQGAWLSTLDELVVLAERNACNDTPALELIRARVPHWYDDINNMIDHLARLGIMVQFVGETGSGEHIQHVQGSPSVSEFIDSNYFHSYGQSLRAWRATRGLNSSVDSNGLPFYDDTEPFEPIMQASLDKIIGFLQREGFPEIDRMVTCAEDLAEMEQYGPSHGPDNTGIFSKSPSPTFVLLPLRQEELSDDAILDYIETPVPDGLWSSIGNNFTEIHGPMVINYILSQPFLHPQSQTMFGGLNGARLGYFMIARMLFSVYNQLPEAVSTQTGLNTGVPNFPPGLALSRNTVLNYVTHAFFLFHAQVIASRDSLKAMSSHRRMSMLSRPVVGLKSVPDSAKSPQVTRTKVTNDVISTWNKRHQEPNCGLGAGAKPTPSTVPRGPPQTNLDPPRAATQQPGMTLGQPIATDSITTPNAPNLAPAKRLSHVPRKSVSAPDLTGDTPMADLETSTVPSTVRTATASPRVQNENPQPHPVDDPHSPASTVDEGARKRHRPNETLRTKLPKPAITDAKNKTPAKSGRSKSAGNWEIITVEDDEIEDHLDISDNKGLPVARQTRSRTRPPEAAAKVPVGSAQTKGRGTSSTIVFGEAYTAFDATADSSFAAPANNAAIPFSMFAGAATKKQGATTSRAEMHTATARSNAKSGSTTKAAKKKAK